MARVLLPPLILLLVFFAFSPGGVPTPAHARDCNAADVVLGEGQIQDIDNTIVKEDEKFVASSLFVMPESGFEGVSLDVHGQDGTQYSAWFPADSKCFPAGSKWWQIQLVMAGDSDNRNFDFELRIGACWRICTGNNSFAGPYNFTVVAYGSSRWIIRDPPRQCDIKYLSYRRLSPSSACTPPPSKTITLATRRSRKITIIIVVSTVVVILIVVIVVVVVVCSRRKPVTSHEARIPSHPAPQPVHPAPWPAHPAPRPAHPAPQPAHPAPQPQFNSGQERAVQDTDSHIYDVLTLYEVPRLHGTESHTNDHVPVYRDVAAPAQPRPESPIYQNVSLYDDVAAPAQPRPESPIYQNVSLYDDVAAPAGRPQDPQGRESKLYLTVL